MSDLDLTNYFLTGIISSGPWMLALALFIGALGVPIPGSLFVLAAGAFIQQEVLATSAILTGFIGVILGDMASYSIGRLAKLWIVARWNHKPVWQSAQNTFNRRGGLAVFLTRFLLTPLALPTNLVAGSSGYSATRFLAYDVVGEITWFILYGGLGYAFGTQWELVNDYMGNVSGLGMGLLVLGVGFYFLRRKNSRNGTA